jgi:hypothetical protein
MLEMKWRDVVLGALHRFSMRHGTRSVDRQSFLLEELNAMIIEADSLGNTPDQTVSRVLQELRDEQLIEFFGNGKYLLLDSPLQVETEDLPDEALDFAIKHGKLRIGDILPEDVIVLARHRKGQDRIRALTLENYQGCCALCDVREQGFLRAAHIARWADDIEGRANLHNVITMCLIHDALFEQGYFTLADDNRVFIKTTASRTLSDILRQHTRYRPPKEFHPEPQFLRQHRERIKFQWNSYVPQ